MNVDAYVFTYLRPDGQWGAVADADKRLVTTVNELLALAFSTVLERRTGLTIAPVKRNPLQVAELVASEHVSVTDVTPFLVFIESDQCKDAEDAVWRAVELANAVPLDTQGDWTAAHDRTARA